MLTKVVGVKNVFLFTPEDWKDLISEVRQRPEESLQNPVIKRKREGRREEGKENKRRRGGKKREKGVRVNIFFKKCF